MSINTLLPTEIARHIQNTNPPKVTLTSSHGVAYKSVRERKDSLEIKALETQTEKDYFYSLLEDSF